jgi:hypothetical protein
MMVVCICRRCLHKGLKDWSAFRLIMAFATSGALMLRILRVFLVLLVNDGLLAVVQPLLCISSPACRLSFLAAPCQRRGAPGPVQFGYFRWSQSRHAI